MLPDFPATKRQFKHFIERLIYEQMREAPVSQLVTHKKSFEGHRTAGSVRATDSDSSTFEEFVSEKKLDRNLIIQRGAALFFEAASSTASEFRIAQEKLILEDINKIADLIGGSIVRGSGLTFESFLEGIKKMSMSFGDDGEPKFEMVLSPALMKQIQQENWNENPVYKAQLDTVIDEKRGEWLKREKQRRLID